MTLAPPGTPLWHPQKDDFAPRLGVAWQPLPNLVMRAGAGIFYDLGYSTVADGISAFPYAQQKTILNTSFPLSAANAAPPPFTTTPPASYLVGSGPNHVLPRTYEWNAAVERTFGKSDVLTLTYLGAAGRKLMRRDLYYAPNPNFTGEFDLLSNGADSSYQALQAPVPPSPGARSPDTALLYLGAFDRRCFLRRLLPACAPRRFAFGARFVRLRHPSHILRARFPITFPRRVAESGKSIFGNWSTDSIVYARSAPPVNVVTGQNPFGTFSCQEPPAYGARIWFPECHSGLPIRT